MQFSSRSSLHISTLEKTFSRKNEKRKTPTQRWSKSHAIGSNLQDTEQKKKREENNNEVKTQRKAERVRKQHTFDQAMRRDENRISTCLAGTLKQYN